MKRIFLISIILVIILAAGCSANEKSEMPSETPPEDIAMESPGEIQIFYPELKSGIPNDNFLMVWQEYMKDKHNLDIKLKYTIENHASDVKYGMAEFIGIDTKDIEKNATNGGFVYIDRKENLVKLISSGLVVPVNDYLKDISSLSNLSDIILKQFSDSAGNIWAIPLAHEFLSGYRVYDKNWLSEWGKSMPENIDEFLAYAHYIKDSDPDGNGKKDSYIQMYTNYPLLEFEDIFRAYRCYVDYGEPIGYNPKSGNFEFALLNENFQEAFAFIKNLYDEELIIQSVKGLHEGEDGPFFVASNPYSLSSSLSEMSIERGYYLKGLNDSELIRSSTNVYCLAILNDTENASEKIDYFISKLIGSQDCQMDLYCGIKEQSYKEYDDYYTFTYSDDMDNILPLIRINTDIKSDSFERKNRIFGKTEADIGEVHIERMLHSYKLIKQRELEGVENYKSGQMYAVSYLIYGNDLKELNSEIKEMTHSTLMDMLEGKVSIEVGIHMYNGKLNSMGVIKKLDDININIDSSGIMAMHPDD